MFLIIGCFTNNDGGGSKYRNIPNGEGGWGGLYLERPFNGGFIFGGAYTWRGLFSEFYGTSLLKRIRVFFYQTFRRLFQLGEAGAFAGTFHKSLILRNRTKAWTEKEKSIIVCLFSPPPNNVA